PTPRAPARAEPVRHKVERGETAYSIARLYNVTVRSLGEWNGLGPDMALREGQYLIIPVASEAPPPRTANTSRPGAGSATPTPPSATAPLPRDEAKTAEKPAAPVASPGLSSEKTTSTRMGFPVKGKIIRAYQKGKNEGIDIAASAGGPVVAAADGAVVAITRNTDQVPILVVRHPDNLLSVYANIQDIAVQKGDSVKRGQTIAKVRATDPAFVHFELRKGIDSVDPMPYLQ
ncbi:M23 family metallopeptidase, partial [Rhodovulum imhoffii]